jgi:hypothetical protein
MLFCFFAGDVRRPLTNVLGEITALVKRLASTSRACSFSSSESSPNRSSSI